MRKALWASLAAALAAGCADIEAARRAQDPATRAPGERTVTAAEVGLGPGAALALDRAVEIALACSPSTAIARRQAEAAAARVDEARAGVLPSASGSASNTFSKAQGASGTSRSFGASVSAAELVYDFGRSPALIRQAGLDLVAAQLALRSAEVGLAASVREQFFDVLKQQELVAVDQETVRQFEKRLEQVKGFVEVGTRIKYDLTKAQVDLGNARLALVRARTALAVSRDELNRLLGLAEAPEYAVAKPAAEAWAQSQAECLSEAARAHPKVLQPAALEAAASAGVDAAVADLFPKVNVQGALSWTGSPSPISWSASLSPVVSWLLFGGWAPSARLRESVANLRAAQAARAQAEQDVFRDVRKAHAALGDAQERLAIATLTTTQAEENLDLVQGRYAVGKSSSVELTDAQVGLANARGEKIQAEYDVQIAIAQLKQAIGRVR